MVSGEKLRQILEKMKKMRKHSTFYFRFEKKGPKLTHMPNFGVMQPKIAMTSSFF